MKSIRYKIKGVIINFAANGVKTMITLDRIDSGELIKAE